MAASEELKFVPIERLQALERVMREARDLALFARHGQIDESTLRELRDALEKIEEISGDLR